MCHLGGLKQIKNKEGKEAKLYGSRERINNVYISKNERPRSSTLTVIACQFKLRATSSSLPFDQYFISLGRSKAWPRLSVTWSLSPFLQAYIEESKGRCPSPNLKELCQLEGRRVEDEATSVSIMTGRSAALGPGLCPKWGKDL